MFVFVHKECDGLVLEEFPMGAAPSLSTASSSLHERTSGRVRITVTGRTGDPADSGLQKDTQHSLLSSLFPAILRQLRRALVLDTVVP